MPTGNNTMCQSMKAVVLLLLLLHCSSGITITPISFIVSSALTATFVFSWSPTVLSAETSISVTATFSDTELNSIPIVVLTTSATVTTSSVLFPMPSSSVVDPTEIIMFPTDIVTETILSTSLGTEIVPITATDTSVATTPVISTNTTTLLSTTSLSSVDGITMILTSPPVLTTFLSQTTLGSLQSLTPTVTTVLTSLLPTPTPTLVPINLVVVAIQFSISSIAKRDTSNYTNIESEIANVTGISAERINIVSLRREDMETIVINATIVELNSTEFITLHTVINSGMVSITYEGMTYSSLSIELQPQPGKPYKNTNKLHFQMFSFVFCKECSKYDERNYDCSALKELRPCPSNMMCQDVLNNASQFCVPCQCNLIPDDASCRDNCISNVCVPLCEFQYVIKYVIRVYSLLQTYCHQDCHNVT